MTDTFAIDSIRERINRQKESELKMAPTLDLEALVLKAGAHPAGSQEMCVMEAVALIAGEPWSDSPQGFFERRK